MHYAHHNEQSAHFAECAFWKLHMLQSGQVEKYIYKVHVLQLPGGSPQGTRLGLFLFLILVNFAGYQDLEKKLGEHITVTKTKRQIIP